MIVPGTLSITERCVHVIVAAARAGQEPVLDVGTQIASALRADTFAPNALLFVAERRWRARAWPGQRLVQP